MQKTDAPERRPMGVLTREEIAGHVRQSRSERYIRTAHLVQSKWFMIGGAAAIAVFLVVTYLVSR